MIESRAEFRCCEQCDRFHVRNQFGNQLKPLDQALRHKKADAGQIAAGAGEIVDEPFRDRVTNMKNDRDRRGCRFRRELRRGAPFSDDDIDLAGDEFSG